MKINFKNLNRLLFSILILLVFIPLNIFAADPPPTIYPVDGDPMAYYEIHPQDYEIWRKNHNFDPNYIKIDAKKISDKDQLFKEFKEKHKAEADSMMYQDEEWNCYEIYINHAYGNFYIESKHTKDENTYNIWPEQFKLYVSRFDEKTNQFEEPKEYTKVKNDAEANDLITKGIPNYTLVQDYNSHADGRSYYVNVSLSEKYREETKDYSEEDTFRVYVFQGHPDPIPNDLLAGEYKIPLSVRYATRPGMYSMASGAVEDYGKLIVGNDGSLKLKMKFKPMVLSDAKFTGNGEPLEGHLTDLWTYNSIDDFNDFKKNMTYFSENKIYLNNSKYLKSTYTRKYFNYPEEFVIPLEYSNGKPNYESQKMFTVRVDAMGSMDPEFNLLMRHKEMVLEKVDLPSGKYEAMPLIDEKDTMNAGVKGLWENGKFKYTKEEYNKKLADSTIDNYSLLNTDIGVNPYYEVEFKDNKANLTVSYVKGVVGSDGPEEFGLVKINENKDIRYKTADGSLKPIEILEEENFTLEPAKTKYGKIITKIKLDNVPLSKLGDINQIIYLENARYAHCYDDWGDMTVDVKPHEGDDPIENMYGINNFDIKKMVLVESTTPDLNKAALQEKINEAKAIEQGKKTDEAFNTLEAAITSAEEVLNSATEQTPIDGAVTTLNKAIETFNASPEKQAQLNKTELDAKIKDAEKISQGKKSEDAFKTLKAAIEAAKNVLNSANTQDQISEALTNLNKAIEAFNKSADVNVTPGASEKVYNIPVKLRHSVQDKESMGNKALVSPAKVSINGDDVNIDLTFQGIEVPLGTTKFYGHLTNLFSFEGNTTRGRAIPAEVLEQMEDNAMDGSRKQFPKVFRIKLTKTEFDKLKDDTLYVKVWVDAMDGIAGGTPGAGAQNARLVFDKSKMNEATPGGETPTPTPTPTPPIPTPDLTNRTAVIDALRSYSNLGGPQYTYQSNMRYVNAYNSLMNLLSKPVVTDSEVKSAIDELKSAAAGLALDTSKSNNSGNNNQGWGNNNQGWGNNNQGWGNNNQNNQNNNQNNGPVTIQYEVPVEILHAHQSGYSMANAAINHTARVEERDGKFRYSVNFHSIQREFGGKTLTGNLTNLFIIDGSKYRADQSGSTWSWVMNGKYDKVNIAVWVDAMDEIVGKGPGGGEQNAILTFNWNGAREVGRYGGNNNQQNQQNQQAQTQSSMTGSSFNSFKDISGHWAKQAIDYVVGKGYFFGVSSAEFGPNKSITRGQFVTVLGRMLNVNTSIYGTQNFNDVKSSMYYSSYIAWANKMGIVSGVGQGRFAPEKELTREEMAVIMSKFLKVSNKNLNAKGNSNGFMDDGKIESWAKEAVKEMARLGVVNGIGDGNFAPKSPFTRAQVAQVLFNIDHN
ncbi:S-layer homology domain-containing protein [Peptoniphilus sp.]|uniref:S-layer homology domain-containing protein n=1 Tax=Peptoniphilus sp. TaxID=1971214 RepID=UPI0039941CC5